MTQAAVKVTVLVDYAAKEGLETEHGFAAWVQVGGESILFDTGQTVIMKENAQKLGLNLKDVSVLALSHGHFDHTGMIPTFLAENTSAKVYFVEGVHVDRYSCKPGTPVRTISIQDESSEALKNLPAERVVEHVEPVYILPGVGLTGKVPRSTNFEDVGGPFFLDIDSVDGDLIEDDQSMWFETEEGLVVLVGCCHAGIVNTVNYIREITGIQKVKGIIGGMHLVNADANRLGETIKAMQDWSPSFLVPCHCTGDAAAEQMVAEMPKGIVHTGHAGHEIEVGVLSPKSAY